MIDDTFQNRIYPSESYNIMEQDKIWPQATGHLQLATIAKSPETLEAIARARAVADKDRWWSLCRDWFPTPEEKVACLALLETMPGYCCMNDAANIAARSK